MNPRDCPSSKWWFLRRQDAEKSARFDEGQYGWKMRAYHCNDCDWYHKARVKHKGQPVLLLDWVRQQ